MIHRADRTFLPLVLLLILGSSALAADGTAPGFGWLAILPPLLAIGVALTTRQVLPSLFFAVFLGAIIFEQGGVLAAFARTTTQYFVDAVADRDHAAILLFSMALSGMVGVMSRSGGSQGIVDKLAPWAKTRVWAQLSTWMMGLIIFFDDYANTLLVGTTMRPLTDRFRISRAKLAFIVDATAAPVAGLAAISTWIGFEVGLIQEAFKTLGRADDAYWTFVQTIPLRYYSIFCLFLVFVICLSGRDFGPMLRAERDALEHGSQKAGGNDALEMNPALIPSENQPRHWLHAVLPILLIFLGTAYGLWYTGMQALPDTLTSRARGEFVQQAIASGELPRKGTLADETWTLRIEEYVQAQAEPIGARTTELLASPELKDVISGANTSSVLLFVSFLGSLLAVFLPLGAGVLKLDQALEAWMEGAKNLVPALMILVLAWSLGAVCGDLGTAQVISESLQGVLQPALFPALTFLAAAGISFATGSSWGTMSILMPITIPLAVKLAGTLATSAAPLGSPAFAVLEAPILLGAIGAVLAGSCFGDHCSPISDTTILSGIASGCDQVEHVRTQMPYALFAGAVAVGLGHIPAGYGMPTWLCLALGALAVVAVVLLVGQDPSEGLDTQAPGAPPLTE